MAASRLTRDRADPLHEQLARELRQLIATLGEGARIPTEHELGATHGLSRTTVRKAIDALVEEGALYRRRGKGTFVASRRLVHQLDHAGAFLDTFTAHGVTATSQVLAFAWLSGDAVPLPELPGCAALRFERLYTAGGQPQCLVEGYIVEPFAEQISRADLDAYPSFALLTKKLGVTIADVRVAVRGGCASEGQAELLAIREADPMIILHRWMVDADEQLVQYGRYYLPAARFELRLDHSAPAGAGSGGFSLGVLDPAPTTASTDGE